MGIIYTTSEHARLIGAESLDTELTAFLSPQPTLMGFLAPASLTAFLAAQPALIGFLAPLALTGFLVQQALTAFLDCEGNTVDFKFTQDEDVRIVVTLRDGTLETDPVHPLTAGDIFEFVMVDSSGFTTTGDISKTTATPGEFDLTNLPGGQATLVIPRAETALIDAPRDTYNYQIFYTPTGGGDRRKVQEGSVIVEEEL